MGEYSSIFDVELTLTWFLFMIGGLILCCFVISVIGARPKHPQTSKTHIALKEKAGDVVVTDVPDMSVETLWSNKPVQQAPPTAVVSGYTFVAK